MKICTKCHIPKFPIAFYGKNAECKECFLKRSHARYEQKKGAILQKQRGYYQKNKEKILETVKEYRNKNKEKISLLNKAHYQENKEIMKRKVTERYWKNPEQHRERNKINVALFIKNNPERRLAIALKYYYSNKKKIFAKQKQKWHTDAKHRLRMLMSNQVKLRLKGKKGGQNWEKLVGYNADQLIPHLKKTLPNGYTWKDFMDGKLHIDHKIPVAAFNFSLPSDIDFKRCFAINNLQLLPALENIKKGKKLLEPFQPSLLGV